MKCDEKCPFFLHVIGVDGGWFCKLTRKDAPTRGECNCPEKRRKKMKELLEE